VLAVDAGVLAVALGDVVELVRVLGLHERDGLHQLVQVLLQDRVVEAVDELRQEVDVGREVLDGDGRDALDGFVEREGLRGVSGGGDTRWDGRRTRIMLAAWLRASK
jgi:hypothetical protein